MIHIILFFSAAITPFPVLRTSFPSTFSINEEAIVAINEAAVSANKTSRNSPSCFLFVILLFQLLNQLIHLNFLVNL